MRIVRCNAIFAELGCPSVVLWCCCASGCSWVSKSWPYRALRSPGGAACVSLWPNFLAGLSRQQPARASGTGLRAVEEENVRAHVFLKRQLAVAHRCSQIESLIKTPKEKIT